MLKKNNFYLQAFLLLGMTSCCDSNCTNVDVPCTWHSQIKEGMSLEDSSCFYWWEELNDPVITSLIMRATTQNHDVLMASLQSKTELLKTMNDVSAEIAKNTIEFRGLQMRLQILDEMVQSQNEIFTLNKDLSKKGFFGVTKENEDQKTIESFLMQRLQIHFSKEKIILHLSTLVNDSPEHLNEILCQSQELPDLIGDKPVGSPEDLICNDLAVKDARKQYRMSGSKQALYNYQKTVLDTLEKAETAITAFNYESDKVHYLENARNLKSESYELAKDLNHRGLKDDRDVLLTYQEFLSEENAFIQGKVDQLISYINLYHTLSRPWEVSCK